MKNNTRYLLILFLFGISMQIYAAKNNSYNNDVCLTPSAVEITNTTTYSVDFEWTDANPEGVSSLYQYTIVESGLPVGGPTTTQTQGTSVGYMLLNPATTYSLYIRSMCMGTWSDWTEELTFTTDTCDPVDMPYTQDFENLTTYFNLVECTTWEVVSGNYWTTNQLSVSGLNGNSLSYLPHQTQDANSWYILQNGINIEDGDKVKVSFKYKSDGTGTESLALYMATSIDDLLNGDGLQIASLTITDDTVNESVSGPVPFTSTAVYYFGFQALSAADQGIIYIDDLKIEEWECGAPDEIETNDISTDGVSLSWMFTGDNTTHFYQYVVSTNDTEPQEGVSTIISTGTNTNNEVQGLDSNTTYYVYVRSSCSGVWSDWTGPVSFMTLCDDVLLPPTGDESQTLPELGTLADLEVEGENLTWYSDEDLTTELEDTTVVVDGTTYYVTQTIGNCTSEALAITVEVILSVDDINEANSRLKYYPNPVKDFLNISSELDMTHIEVVNILGQTIISQELNTNQARVDMSALSAGNYFVKVKVNGNIKVFKVLR